MSYKPWPDDGCTLADARERTADRELWAQWCSGAEARSGSPQRKLPRSDSAELQHKIDAAFFSLLQTQRLIAYGRKSHPRAAPQRIPAELWPNPKPDWQASAVGENRPGGPIFHSVRVFPVLKAPCRVDLLAGRGLAETFRLVVLDDPEVAALAKAAIQFSPEFERVFVQGSFYARGDSEWPLGTKRLGADAGPEKQSPVGILAKPQPAAVIDAKGALTNRFRALLGVLRRGELVGRGAAADSSALLVLPRTIWSHDEYWLDAGQGDVLQHNPDCEDPPRDRLRRRWLGVLLERPNADPRVPMVEASIQATADSRTGMAGLSTTPPFSPADIVAAGSLCAALEQLVLHHPGIEDLRTKARAASEQTNYLLDESAGFLTPCYGHNEELLPIERTISRFPPMTAEEIESLPKHLRFDPPVEISRFYAAINEHMRHLFDALRQGTVIAIAHTIRGEAVPLNHTIWSHEEYYILPRTGDIFEARPMKMIKRWVGVIFTDPDVSALAKSAAPTPPKAVIRGRATSAAYKECLAWLVALMAASPAKRKATKDELRTEANRRWPDLSERAVWKARLQAIALTGADSWEDPGRPRKPRKKIDAP